jgi:hypothetical protein
MIFVTFSKIIFYASIFILSLEGWVLWWLWVKCLYYTQIQNSWLFIRTGFFIYKPWRWR